MRLSALDLVRYGKFTDRRLDFGGRMAGVPDLHIVYGPNEAGKSTMFSGFLDLLFGIEHASPYGFLHPYPTMRVGGTIEAADRTHRVFRVKRKANSLVGIDDQPLPDNLFSGVLGAIDRDTYQTMFSLDDESIEKGGEAILKSEGELGSLLFSASSGLPDSTAILASLRGQADAFYRPQARKHQLAELKAQLDALRTERNAVDINAREYAALRKTLAQARDRHEEAITRRAELRVTQARLKAEVEALPYFGRLRALRTELAGAPVLPVPPAEWAAELPALRRQEAEIELRLRQNESEMQRRRDALEEFPPDRQGLCLAERLTALQETALDARYVTAERDMPSRLEELARTSMEIGGCLLRLGEAGDRNPADLLLPTGIGARLQDLARRHSALAERCVSARHELQTAAEENRAAERELTRIDAEGGLADASGLSGRLALLRRSDCLLRKRAAAQSLDRLEAELADKLLQLRPFVGSADDLLALTAPPPGALEAWRKAAATLEERQARVSDRIAGEQELLAGEEARLAALSAVGGTLDDASAAALRRRRDDAWEQHKGRLLQETAVAFEEAMGRDDEVTTLRLAETTRLADMRGLSLSLAERRARLASLREQLQRCIEEVAAQAQSLEDFATSCGLPAVTTLSRLEAWLAVRVSALELRAQLRSVRLEFDRAHAEEVEAIRGLSDDLAGIGIREGLSERLEDLMQIAEGIVSQAQTAAAARNAAREAAKRSAMLLEGRRSTLDLAEAEMVTWQEQWNTLLAKSWLAERSELLLPEQIGAMLAVLQDLDKLVQRKADLEYRVAGMRKDQAAFEHAIADLAGGPPADDALATFAALKARAAEAQRLADRRATFLSELARLDDEQRAICAEQELHIARRRLVLEFFDCETVDDAMQQFEAAREQERLRLRIAELEADIASRLGVAACSEAEALLAELDDATVRLELARLDAALEDSDRDVSELHTDMRGKEKALADVEGGDTVAELDQKRRTLLLDIENRALAYLRLRAGVIAAETALRLFRERHRSAMMRRASETFSRISGGEYSGLSAQSDKGQEFLIANAAGGGSKLAKDLSKGTRFQLYLALRIAGYHEIAAARESLPFIADDIMETFDDRRAGRAFEQMAEMARVGQVIYLTHHEHLCEIARSACPTVTIHRL
ncbi:AAA family ATPase [Ensifer adhaerens]|uniref:ATP-binding protein n=1 Tax=Ensifer adhaerens TaxID=106592 RepID=UPI0023AA0AAB|nr:AAA family ATPase [Ensifer adhaerens]WDZ77847.1 AAA family ATPase [Ensifer adhaerens]